MKIVNYKSYQNHKIIRLFEWIHGEIEADYKAVEEDVLTSIKNTLKTTDFVTSQDFPKLLDESFGLISLFDDIEKIEKEERLQSAIDTIRQQFSFTSLLKANALTEGSRVIARSNLVGGHSAGGLDGLK